MLKGIIHIKEGKKIEEYKEELGKQLNELNKLITLAEKRLRKEKNIDKRTVSTSTRRSGYQYYIQEGGKRKYVKAKDIWYVRDIMQRDYDENVHRALIIQRNRIDRFLKLYDVSSIVKAYDELSDARKQLITPLISTNEQYIEEWRRKYPECQNTFPEQGAYITARGEKVRSKSEKIIADLFDRYRIPYVYEPSLDMGNGHVLYPDFAVLNVPCRKTFFWEHFGLISDSTYAKKTLKKMNMYEECGFSVGRNVLFSLESEDSPLNTKLLERKIRSYLL